MRRLHRVISAVATVPVPALTDSAAALFGGIMVVTGPTVVGPLLRNLNIGRRPAQILKWEAIVNDPIGALLAVFIFAWITYEGAQLSLGVRTGRPPVSASRLAAAEGREGPVPEILRRELDRS